METGYLSLTYEEARVTISKYCAQMQSRFADRWSRWPVGANAHDIANCLENNAAVYKGLPVFDEIMEAAKVIRSRA